MKNKSHGFTLIELLVVIAIIAILAAILFPVFAKAREKARQTTCASNEKQISLGILQYVQDYDERFPILWVSQPLPDGIYWPSWVYPYIKSTQVFSCPDDSGDNNLAASLAGIAAENTFSHESYGINGALDSQGPDLTYHGLSLAQLNNPSDLCLLAENDATRISSQSYGGYFGGYLTSHSDSYEGGFANTWYSGLDTPVVSDPMGATMTVAFATPIARHTGGADIAFTDGHVKWVRFAAIFNPPAGVDKSQFKLWHPNAP